MAASAFAGDDAEVRLGRLAHCLIRLEFWTLSFRDVL
jgi:hypothetical protein